MANAMTSFPSFRSNIEQTMKLGSALKDKQQEREPGEGVLNREKVVEMAGKFFGIKGVAASYAVNKTMDILEKMDLKGASNLFQREKEDSHQEEDSKESAAGGLAEDSLEERINTAHAEMQNPQAQTQEHIRRER